MKERYHLSKEERAKEERIKALTSIYEAWEKEKWKVLGIVTSSDDKERKQHCATDIVEFMKQKNVTVCFYEEDELDADKIEKASEELIVLGLRPVDRYADGLFYAKKCDALILVEKCGYSKYKDIEASLKILKDNNIIVAGVVL